MNPFQFAVLLAIACTVRAATLCDSGAKATCPTSDNPSAPCSKLKADDCLKKAPAGGYHRYARLSCPFTCLKLLEMIENTETDETKPPKWECKGSDHTNWLMPYAQNNLDAFGTNFTTRCTTAIARNADACKDCEFGYLCTKACEIDASVKNAA